GGIDSFPNGADANNYLLWVFTIGNGNTVTQATLTTNGDTVTWPTDSDFTTSTGNQIKFVTKGYDLDTLVASVSYGGDLGNGNHKLNIRHGWVGKAKPTIKTSPPSDVKVGDYLNDTATLAGGNDPTGKITFKLFAPGDDQCTGDPLYSQDVDVDSGNGD